MGGHISVCNVSYCPINNYLTKLMGSVNHGHTYSMNCHVRDMHVHVRDMHVHVHVPRIQASPVPPHPDKTLSSTTDHLFLSSLAV